MGRVPKPIKRIVPGSLRREIKMRLLGDEFGMTSREMQRLQALPRLTSTHTMLLGRTIELPDAYWYLWSYREIFGEQIYRFQAGSTAPLIIDCGANIGMSVIYFKHLYPNAEIIAFEPDPNICGMLKRNVRAFELTEVDVRDRAVWNSRTAVTFAQDGTVGGRLANAAPGQTLIQVQTVRLRDLLDRHVDLLKMDIEGAETDVIPDCQDRLGNVDHLFVEYHAKSHERQSLHDILKVIQDAGFRYHIKEAYPVNQPFLHFQDSSLFDLQLNVFAYRV